MKIHKKHLLHHTLFLFASSIILFALNLFFALHRNWAPGNPQEYQTEIAYLIEQLSMGNLFAYCLLVLIICFIGYFIYYIYFIFRFCRKKTTK